MKGGENIMSIDYKRINQEATDKGNNITNSVLVLARIAGVKAKDLAGGMVEDQANGEYLASVVAALVPAMVAKAKEEESK